jgi:hypothetical protein
MSRMMQAKRLRQSVLGSRRNTERTVKSIRLSDGQLKLLRVHGYKALTAERIRTLKLAHEMFLASARFQANAGDGKATISLPEAERRVEKYLETL